jgi:hypothetical protein
MIEDALGVSTYGRLWHQVGTNYLKGVCTGRGDLLIARHIAPCNCLMFKHSFWLVLTW